MYCSDKRTSRHKPAALAGAAVTTSLCLLTPAARADFTWQGATSSTWTDTSNWLSASEPTYGSTNATSRLNICNVNTATGATIVPAIYDPVAAGLAATTNTSFASGRGLVVANAGSGDAGLVVNSGTLSIGGSSNPVLSNAQNGYITMNGGLLDSSSTTSTGFQMLFGANASVVTATLTVNGGEFRSKLLDLDAGDTSASAASNVVLNGGVLTTTGIVDTQGAAVSTITFNGGTLRAAGSSATFLNALTKTTAVVNSKGATIDTNGFNVTVAAPLTGSAGSTGGGLSKVGAGTLTLGGVNNYIGSTTVTLGTLATAGTGTLGGGNLTVGPTAGLSLGDATSVADGATLGFSDSSLIALGAPGGSETIAALIDLSTGKAEPVGTYTFDKLNSDFGVTVFSSASGETLTIAGVPEPTSLLAIAALGGSLALRRRRD